MKPKSKPAVTVKFVALFAAACAAASGMAKACEDLARAILGKGRGADDYKAAVTELSALETASTDGNKHTVRRYTAEALAILAKVGPKATVPTVAADRTDKAQEARKGLGIKKRGVKAKKAAKKGKAENAAPAADFEAQFRAMLKLQAGRASLITWAKAEGFDLMFSMRDATMTVAAPTVAPVAVSTPTATPSTVAVSTAKPKADPKAIARLVAKHTKKANGSTPRA